MTLRWCAPRGNVCASCFNFQSKKDTADEFRTAKVAETLKSEEKRAEYVRQLEEWEDEKRRADERVWLAGGKPKGSGAGKRAASTSMTAQRTMGTRVELLQGILWPEKLWKKQKKTNPPKEWVLTTVKKSEDFCSTSRLADLSAPLPYTRTT